MKITSRVLVILFALLCTLALTTPGISGGKKVLITEVTVFDAKDKPAVKRQVYLEFGSLKEPVFSVMAVTNAKGVATIKHYQEGEARVWVDGNHSTHAATGKAPGKIAVHLGDGPSRFYAIDRHALAAPPEAEQTVDTLAKHLAEPAKNDLEKVRAIFRWITDRIAYDAENLLAGTRGDNSPQGVLKTRTCVCDGYSKLFEALAKKMNLEVAFIEGYGKFKGGRGTHSWNAVKIDGDWKFFDATVGAGSLHNNKFLKLTNEFFFRAAPDNLLFSHFPNDPKWQFRDPPLTKEEFDASPAVPEEIFKMGLPAERIWKMLRGGEVKEFCVFAFTPGRKVILRDGPMVKTLQTGKKYRFLVEAADFPRVGSEQKENRVTFQRKGPLFEGLLAPSKGTLNLYVYGQPNGGKGHGIVHYEVE
jgi:hypothetical protein